MRVLIVDDEKLICEWLEFCISKNPACQLVGIAHNGKEGLELFRQQEPDLVLTDIKMPVMDGIELLHAIRQQSERTKVVLLTAFAEFEMARRALREGADEYLLKTEMNNEVLQQMLGRVIASCGTAEQTNSDTTTTTAQAHAIVRKILRQKEPLLERDLEELRQCGVRWRNNGLFAVAVWKQSLMYGGLHFPKESPARHVAGFDYTDRIYMVVGNLPRALSPLEKERQLTLYAKQLQELNHCMVGSSSVTDEMSMIPAMVRQAALSLSRGFYQGEVRLYPPERSLEALEERDRTWRTSLSGVRVRLYQQSGEARQQILEEFLQDTARQQIGEVDMVTKFCADSYDLLYAQAVSLGLDAENPEQVRGRMASSISMTETCQPVLELAALCSRQSRPAQPSSKAVRLAMRYIRENYSQPLSLEQVAAEVHLTPEYFSRIFKEELGISFVNYLTDVRLRHCVQLLETTALRVQDVAQAVGYSNVSYFSTIFKKKYGMSPYEYRHRSE